MPTEKKQCAKCQKLTGESVWMECRTENFPDTDTTDYLADYFFCPRLPQEHSEMIPGSGRYTTQE